MRRVNNIKIKKLSVNVFSPVLLIRDTVNK